MTHRRLLPALALTLAAGATAATGSAGGSTEPITPRIVLSSVSGANGKVTMAGRIVPKAAAAPQGNVKGVVGLRRVDAKGVTKRILGIGNDVGASAKFKISRPDAAGTRRYKLIFAPASSAYETAEITRTIRIVKPRRR